MSHPEQRAALRLEETVCVGRLETLEQVQALLESLDDLRPGLRWAITCRQTRQEPEKTQEATSKRSVVL